MIGGRLFAAWSLGDCHLRAVESNQCTQKTVEDRMLSILGSVREFNLM